MDFRTFTAGDNDNDRRLDKIIRIIVPSISLSEIYKAIRKGLIKVNDKKAAAEYRVQSGDKISVAEFFFKPSASNPKASDDKNKISDSDFPDIPVLFKNENIIIFNKPRNISVHGGGNKINNSNSTITLEAYTKALYKKENPTAASLSFTPGPLHRIDRFTTGIVAFSWSLNGARWFSENIKNHTIQKKYVGIVQGNLKAQQKWQSFIKNEEADGAQKNFHTVIATDTPEEGKAALTIVTPLAHGKINGLELTLAEFEIHTGRHHQIRAQAAQNGFPLYGDIAYGGARNPQNTYFLHAAELQIPENPIGLPKIIKAPIPEDFPLPVS